VPNERIAAAPVVNVSQRETRRLVMNLGLVYDLTADQVRQALGIVREAFTGHEQTDDVWVFFNEFGESALNIQVTYWCKQVTPREFLQAVEEINLQIKERLDAAGIAMAFPTRTVVLKGGGGGEGGGS
jgi:MscS family membrane protein